MNIFIFTKLLPRFDGAPPSDPKEEEIKPGQPSETDDFNFKRDSVKSIDQIAKESQKRIRKQKQEDKKKEEEKESPSVETTPDEKVEESKPAPEKTPDETKVEPKVDKELESKKERENQEKREEEIAQRAAKEAAEQVSKEAKDAFKSEIDKILNKDKTTQEQQKEADELIANWEKEGRLPKDYKEVIQETLRINEARMEQRLKEIEEKRTQEETKKQDDIKKSQEQRDNQEKQRLTDFQNQITADLEDIYAAKFLPRPQNIEEINNPNTTDPAAKETQKVFEFGVKLNRERAQKNLPAVTSLNKIYFLHYKPAMDAAGIGKSKQDQEQPAGATAPVGGTGNQSQTGKTEKAYVYARDHGKSFDQLKAEAVARFRKAMKL